MFSLENDSILKVVCQTLYGLSKQIGEFAETPNHEKNASCVLAKMTINNKAPFSKYLQWLFAHVPSAAAIEHQANWF